MPKLNYNLDEISSFSVAAGLYHARLMKVEQTVSARSRKPMLVWTWRITTKGSEKGKEIRSYTSLVEGALGNLKDHLTAFNLKGKVKSDTSRLIGKEAVLVITVGPSTAPGREGMEFSSVSQVLPESSDEDEDVEEEDEDVEGEEEEEPAPRKSSRKRIPEPEPEEEDEEEDEEEEDEEEEEEPAPRRSARRVVASKKAGPASKVTARKGSQGKLPF